MVSARFEGKVALVTGGANGIGLAITERLLTEGARVVVGDLDDAALATLQQRAGDGVIAQRCDVREEAAVATLVAAAARFGPLDAAFNVAGLGAFAPIVDMPEETWNLVLDVCLKGVFFAVKHEAKAMQAQRRGAIVNIASLNSHVPMFGGAAYCCAKAGVEMLSRNAALELAGDGIRVNTVSPGLTATQLTAGIRDLQGAESAFMERIPLRRWGSPADMAAAALFLASDDAGYVSGSNLFVDGAWETTGYPDLRPYTDALGTS